ncbi:MAG: pilus assembly PilX family protein [Gammaproteobacteria bacterium]
MTPRQQKGVALITVLLMISLLSLIGIAAMQAASMQTRIARAQQQMDFSRSVADAGLQEAATYIDTGHANYTAETSLPITPSYSINGESPSISISASTNGIYTLSSSYEMDAGSSANLMAYVRRPMAAALLAGRIKDIKGGSEISGTDQCGNQDLAGLATTRINVSQTFKHTGDAADVTSNGPISIAYGMSAIDVANLLNNMETADLPTTIITNGKNYNTAHGDPTSDATCNPSNMQVLLVKDDLEPKSNFKGCGLLLVDGNIHLDKSSNIWRGAVLTTGGIITKGGGIIGAAISSEVTNDVNEMNSGYIRWCSTAANWANDLTRETGAQLWFSRWTDLTP